LEGRAGQGEKRCVVLFISHGTVATFDLDGMTIAYLPFDIECKCLRAAALAPIYSYPALPSQLPQQ